MKNNSVICLNEEHIAYKVPEHILIGDTLDNADIGWVDQMLPLIKSYTKIGHNVLDIFAGLGSTAIAAKILNRNAFMVEIETIRSQLIKQRWDHFSQTTHCDLHTFNHDSLSFLKQNNILPPIQLALTNTPYFSVNPHQISQQSNSLYNSSKYEDYLYYIEECLIELRKHLAGGATCIMTCENIRNQQGELVPLAWDIAGIMQKHYLMFDEKILYYPNTKRVIEHPLYTNRQHEYVFIAKKYLSLKQCLFLKELILQFQALNLRFEVTGSFKRFLIAEDSQHIGDLDLIIFKEVNQLSILLTTILKHYTYTIWSWNDELKFSDFPIWNFEQIFSRHYLRLLLNSENDTIQIDLMFD